MTAVKELHPRQPIGAARKSRWAGRPACLLLFCCLPEPVNHAWSSHRSLLRILQQCSPMARCVSSEVQQQLFLECHCPMAGGEECSSYLVDPFSPTCFWRDAYRQHSDHWHLTAAGILDPVSYGTVQTHNTIGSSERRSGRVGREEQICNGGGLCA